MKIRVLLADDHALLREGLAALLESEPDIAVVAQAAEGREALARALEHAPDVALLDIAMPGLNGIEAAKLLASRAPRVRVVVLSMHSTSEHVHRAFAAGALGFVLKEAAAADAIAAVRAAYAGRRFLSRGLVLPAAGASPLERLSAREREVLQLVVEGHSSAEIAARVHLSPKSVDSYRSRLMAKLGVGDVAGLVKFALQHGITPTA